MRTRREILPQVSIITRDLPIPSTVLTFFLNIDRDVVTSFLVVTLILWSVTKLLRIFKLKLIVIPFTFMALTHNL